MLRRAAELPTDGFADLLTLEAIDEIVSRRGLRTPFVRMTRDGEVLPTSRFTRGGGAGADIADQVADDKVLAEFAAGATLVLQGLHRLWPPVQHFATALSTQLGHPVQANAYVTPPQNRGFAPHYDVHDVFVLQFAGRKRWSVHAPVLEIPLREQPFGARKAQIAARAAEPPLVDAVLERGDVLYLPRGFVHSATSLAEVSGHLTIGVHPLTRHLLATQIFDELANDVALRRALPLGADLADEAVLEGEMQTTLDLIRAALDRVDRKAVALGIGRHLAASTRPAPLNPLEQLSFAANLAPGSGVRLRLGLRASVRSDGDGVAIVLPDRELRLEATPEAAARAAVSGVAVRADDLPETDVSQGMALLARLLREGVVVPA